MLLAIDIGNTNVKSGLFEHDKLSDFKVHPDIEAFSKYLFSISPKTASVCSVNPSVTKDVIAVLKEKNIRYSLITPDSNFNLEIDYKTPETLGMDRLCSAEGAFFRFKNSEHFKNYNKNTYILSIDFGTATTINAIEYPGKFIGGLIAPGIEMMFDSLHNKTAQLPRLDVSAYTNTIGNDTNSSIASGVINSIAGMIYKTVENLRDRKSANDINIYITGGNAKKMIPFLHFIFKYEEGLVLYGVNSLWNSNK